MNNIDILEFKGDYRWLSNFYPAEIFFDGNIFPSIENAYQAAKTLNSQREPFLHCTAGQAKRLGRTVEVRADWDLVKVPIMRSLIAQKYYPGSWFGEKLKATGRCRIIEGNDWGDVFWGMCNGRGNNWLGWLLMEQRAFLREFSAYLETGARQN